MLLGVAFASSAAAQERQPGPKYGTIRLGPLYLSVVVQATAGYDTNVYNTPTALGDQSVTVTPSLQAVLPLTRHARLRGTGGIVPQYFSKQASERHTDVFGTALAEVDIGPLTAFGGVGGGRYRQRFSLEIDQRLLRHESNDTFGAKLHVGHRITATASQLSTTYTFDPTVELDGRPVSVALDRDTVIRRIEVSFPLTRKTSLVPSVDLLEDRFLHPQPGLLPRTSSQRYAAALDFSDLAFLNGRVAAGVRHFSAGQGVAPYDGLFLAVNVGMPFIAHTRLLLSSTRDVAYSATQATVPGSPRNTYVNSIHRAEVWLNLPLKMMARPFVGYAEARYLLPSDQAGTTPRLDRALSVGGAVLRRLGDHVSMGVTAQHVTRKSPIDDHQYDGTVYGLTGEVRF